jgi:hypothetical protein
MAPEQLGLRLSGQRSEAHKVSYLDAGDRPIHVRGQRRGSCGVSGERSAACVLWRPGYKVAP